MTASRACGNGTAAPTTAHPARGPNGQEMAETEGFEPSVAP
jgi:hypothetical protein